MGIIIGSYRIDPAVVLAPMSGITDRPFRQLVKSMGAPLVVSEMVASHELVRAAAKQRRVAGDLAEEAPMAVQLAGFDPETMGEAAKIAVDRGAGIVDINFGCPAKKVVGKACGSALMREEDLATRIMAAVVEAVPVPVTMKMRLGWDIDEMNAPTLARRAEAVGIRALTVHGRTRMQFYTGRADWAAVAPTVAATRLPVIVNGDIDGPESIDAALAQSGAAGVMLGRAVQGKPWRIAQAMAWLRDRVWPADPDAATRGTLALRHFESLLAFHGEVRGIRVARKHLAAWCDGIPGAAAYRQAMFAADDPARVRELTRTVFDRAAQADRSRSGRYDALSERAETHASQVAAA